MKYAAFISYRVESDRSLASQIQRDLHRAARPAWYKLRLPVISVFRDQTNIPTTSGLSAEVQGALRESKYLILIASRGAASSAWVGEEVGYWLTIRSPRKILIVLADGNIVWNPDAQDFSWVSTDALPRVLKGAFHDQPKYEDLRGLARPGRQDARYREAIRNLSAAIRELTPDKIESEELRQRQVARRFVTAVIVALSILTALSVAMAIVATRQQKAATLQAEKANREALRSDRTASLLVSIFEPASPYWSGQKEMSAKQVLDTSLPLISSRLEQEPVLKASLLMTAGEIYTHLGEFEKSLTLLSESKNSLRRFGAEESRLVAKVLYGLGVLELERSRPEVARTYLREALSRSKTADDGADVLTVDILDGLGRAANYLEQYSEGVERLTQAVDRLRLLDPPDPLRLATSISNLGLVRFSEEEYEDAGLHFREAVKIFESELGDSFYPDFANVLNNLGAYFAHIGDDRQAASAYEQAIRIRRDLAPHHPDLAIQLSNLAHTYRKLGELETAKGLVEEAIEIIKSALGEESASLVHSLKVYGNVLHETGEHAEEFEAYSKALSIVRAGSDRRNRIPEAVLENDIANHYRDAGEFDEAEVRYDKAIQRIVSEFGYEELPTIFVQLLMNRSILLVMSNSSYDALQASIDRALSCARVLLEPNDERVEDYRLRLAEILREYERQADLGGSMGLPGLGCQ